MKSKINWNVGEPKHDGLYLVTFKYYDREDKHVMLLEKCGYYWCYGNYKMNIDVFAWCNLVDIEPYKEQ